MKKNPWESIHMHFQCELAQLETSKIEQAYNVFNFAGGVVIDTELVKG